MYERKSTENMVGAVMTEGTVCARASCLLPLDGKLRAGKDFGLFCSLTAVSSLRVLFNATAMPPILFVK